MSHSILSDGLRHTCVIVIGDEVPDDTVQKLYDMYQRLAADCGGKAAGILAFELERNTDTRKGRGFAELAIFRDDAALQAFRAHPAHTAITDILRQSKKTTWLVGNYVK